MEEHLCAKTSSGDLSFAVVVNLSSLVLFGRQLADFSAGTHSESPALPSEQQALCVGPIGSQPKRTASRSQRVPEYERGGP